VDGAVLELGPAARLRELELRIDEEARGIVLAGGAATPCEPAGEETVAWNVEGVHAHPVVRVAVVLPELGVDETPTPLDAVPHLGDDVVDRVALDEVRGVAG